MSCDADNARVGDRDDVGDRVERRALHALPVDATAVLDVGALVVQGEEQSALLLIEEFGRLGSAGQEEEDQADASASGR